MTGIPRLPVPDSSLGLVSDGYLFGIRRFRRVSADAFRTRLLGAPVTVARGIDASRMFYESDRFSHDRSMPASVARLLQDAESVRSFDSDPRRKDLFAELLTNADELARLRTLFARNWVRATEHWPRLVVLYDELVPILTRTALQWVGVDPDSVVIDREAIDVESWGEGLESLVNNSGRITLANRLARAKRRETEQMAQDLVAAARAHLSPIPALSPLGTLVRLTDEDGARLSQEEAALELLNALPSIVAVARFSVFCALALHKYPRSRDRIASTLRDSSGDVDEVDAMLDAFVNEVRRYYPFFSVIGGSARGRFEWHGESFEVGDWMLLDLYGTDHDPELWAEPNRFLPSRFEGRESEPNALVPRGGNDLKTGHRRPGDDAATALMKETVVQLLHMQYRVPEQDLRVSLRRFPALPQSRFVMETGFVMEQGGTTMGSDAGEVRASAQTAPTSNAGAAGGNSGAAAEDSKQKPQSLPEVTKPTWKYVLRKTVYEFGNDRCTDLAAGLTYHAVLSLFPGLLALIGLLGLIGQAKTTSNAILDVVQNVAPGEVTNLLRGPINEVVNSPSAGFAVVTGIVVALWSASGYIRSFSRAMNRIYDIEEGRPFWRLLPVMLGMTLVILILVGIMGLLLAATEPILMAIGNTIGLGPETIAVWNIAKWPILVILAIITLALLYYVTPNVKQPHFRWISMGAVLALVIMALASLGFAFYVSNFSHYNKTYGAIGAVIVLLLWLWILNLALLFGAEFDSETERGRELQAGLPAAENLQLPPRDTRGLKKKEAKRKKIIAAGRTIRREHEQEDSKR